MTMHEATELVGYNDWANARLLGCADELSPEQWSRDLGGSYPTLLRVVAHIVGGEWIWLRRCQGDSPASAPAWFNDPDPGSLWEALAQVRADRLEFLSTLSAADLDREVRYTLLNGSDGVQPLATLLRHTVNHSTYHRGQVAAMLRRLGVAPPATDLLVYAAEQSASSSA
jgi:uncharacterized damage-inducible protein DinB